MTHTRQNFIRRFVTVAVAAAAGIALAAPAAVAGSGAEPTKGATSRTAPIPAVAPAKPGTNCTVDAKLVPSCNVLWGAAAGGDRYPARSLVEPGAGGRSSAAIERRVCIFAP